MRSRYSASTVALMYAVLGGLWIVISGTVLTFAVSDPVMQGRVELIKGFAFVVVTSGLLYLLIRKHGPDPDARAGASAGQSVRSLLPLWFVLVLSVPLIVLGVYALHARDDEAGMLADLSAKARLKAEQVETWLAERRGDSVSLAMSSGFIERVVNYRASGDAHEESAIRNRLEAMIDAFGYAAITVFDPTGKRLLSYGDEHPLPDATRALFAGSLADGKVRMSPMLRDAKGGLHLDFVAPLRLPEKGGESRPIALVVLHEDPMRRLFPSIQNWPSASESGEFLMVVRDNDSVLFLNELRHRKGTSLSLREPLNVPTLSAVAAVKSDQPGAMRGVDYRGVEVLATWRSIEGTDWRLVAKIDRDEALQGARITALWVGAVTLFGVLLLVVTLSALWRARRRADQIEARAESDRMFKLFFELPFVGMAITSPETKRWVRFNDELCRILGYSREELGELSWAQMTHPGDVDKDVAEFERVMRGASEGYMIDKRLVRKDGAIVHATIDVKCQRKPDGTVDFFVATIRDITEQHRSRERIATLMSMYATLSRCNEAIVRCENEDALLAQICAAATEQGGMKLAWVGMVDEQGQVRPTSSAGEGQAYLEGIVISLEEGDPSGQGPTGTAIRENRPYWCQDFAADPRTAAWHERGARFGWGSSAALPLRRNGVAVGCFTLYSERVGMFDEPTQGLLTEMAADISFALDNFDREARRKKAETTLLDQYEELRRWYRAMLGREERNLELKHEVNALLRQSGQAPRYASVDDEVPEGDKK